jgi:DNA-binding NarL/FixJ family response regulator
MYKNIKIITVDDHEIFRKGLNMILSKFPDVEIIGEASNGLEFLELLNYLTPDIVFMDIKMPKMDGILTATKALERKPDLKIIAISMFGEEEFLEKMIKAGAKGFLLKNVNKEELSIAIEQVRAGNNYFSSEFMPYFTRKFIGDNNRVSDDSQLTMREIEILKFVAMGMTNQEIASELYISKRTVDGHKANILAKTDSKNVVSLLIYAIKHDLIKI